MPNINLERDEDRAKKAKDSKQRFETAQRYGQVYRGQNDSPTTQSIPYTRRGIEGSQFEAPRTIAPNYEQSYIQHSYDPRTNTSRPEYTTQVGGRGKTETNDAKGGKGRKIEQSNKGGKGVSIDEANAWKAALGNYIEQRDAAHPWVNKIGDAVEGQFASGFASVMDAGRIALNSMARKEAQEMLKGNNGGTFNDPFTQASYTMPELTSEQRGALLNFSVSEPIAQGENVQKLYDLADASMEKAQKHGENLGKFGNWTADVISTSVAQLPQIMLGVAAGAVTGGLGAAPEVIKAAQQIASLGYMAASVFGSTYNEGVKQGLTYDQATTRATILAATEVATEQMWDINKLYGGGGFDADIEAAIFNKVSDPVNMYIWLQAIGGLTEGIEEGTSSFVGNLVDAHYFDKYADYTGKEQFGEMVADAWADFCMGVASAVLMAGAGGQYSNAGFNQWRTELIENYENMSAEDRAKANEVAAKQNGITVEEAEQLINLKLSELKAYDRAMANVQSGKVAKGIEIKTDDQAEQEQLATEREQNVEQMSEAVSDIMVNKDVENQALLESAGVDLEQRTVETEKKANKELADSVVDVQQTTDAEGNIKEHIVMKDGSLWEVNRYNGDFSDIDELQRSRLAKVMETKARLKGSPEVVLVESLPMGANGVYANGKVYIDVHSKQLATRIYFHEMTHNNASANSFSEFKNYALEQMARLKGDGWNDYYNAVVDSYKEAYNSNKENFNDLIEEELAARYVEEYLFKTQAEVDAFVRRNGNLAQRIWQSIKDFLGNKNFDEIARAEKMFAKAFSETKNAARDNSYTRYSLTPVADVEPTSDYWNKGATAEDVRAVDPNFRKSDAQNDYVEDIQPDVEQRIADRINLANTRDKAGKRGNGTQRANTVVTYDRLYDTFEHEGFSGTILDASSGLGLGTDHGIQRGFNVEDIEPYYGEGYKPIYSDYSRLNKQYDAIISSAVINVLTQEDSNAMVKAIGDALKPGGRAYITVRSASSVDGSLKGGSAIRLSNDAHEWYVPGSDNYQRGFETDELKAYLEDVLGEGYRVESSPKYWDKQKGKYSKWGDTSAVIVKDSDYSRSGIENESANESGHNSVSSSEWGYSANERQGVGRSSTQGNIGNGISHDTKGSAGDGRSFLGDDGSRWRLTGETFEKVKGSISLVDDVIHFFYHGTNAEFDNISKSKEMGFHVGDEATAKDVVRNEPRSRIVKVLAAIKNPIVLEKEPGNWKSYAAARILESEGIISHDEYNTVNQLFNAEYDIDSKSAGTYDSDSSWYLRKILEDKGYDGIKYRNLIEEGNDPYSYMAFDSDQLITVDDGYNQDSWKNSKEVAEDKERDISAMTSAEKDALISKLQNELDQVNREANEKRARNNRYNTSANSEVFSSADNSEGKFSISNTNATDNLGGRGRGYVGNSMSVNAAMAYTKGEMPLSKWNKSGILEQLQEINPDVDFSKLSLDILKKYLLKDSGWHHTGAMYNKTDFYALDSEYASKLTQEDVNQLAERQTSEPKAKRDTSLDSQIDDVYEKVQTILNAGTSNVKTESGLLKRVMNGKGIDAEYQKALDYIRDKESARVEAWKKLPTDHSRWNDVNLFESDFNEYVRQNYADKKLSRNSSMFKDLARYFNQNAQATDSAMYSMGNNIIEDQLEFTPSLAKRLGANNSVYTLGFDWIPTITTKNGKELSASKIANDLYQRVVNGQAPIDALSKDAAAFVQKVRSSGGIVQTIAENQLVGAHGEVTGEPNYKSVFLDAVPEAEREDFDTFRQHLHNIDRMSFEDAQALENAQNEYNQFVAEHPEYERYNDEYLKEMSALAGDDADAPNLAKEYMDLRKAVEDLENAQNKPVISKEQNGERVPYTADESRKIVAEMSEEHPEWMDLVKQQNDWWDKFNRMWLVDTGLVSEEKYNELRERYPNYMPTYREEGKHGTGAGASGNVFNTNAIRQAKGSLDKALPYYQQYIEQMQRTVTLALRNQLGQVLVDYATNNALLSEAQGVSIAKDSTKNVSEILETMDNISETEKDGLKELKNGSYQMVVRTADGKVVTLNLNKETFNALNWLTRKNNEPIAMICNMMSKVSSPIKTWITGRNPLFIVSNFFRDMQTYLVNSSAPTTGEALKYYGKAIAEAWKKGDIYTELKAMGGLNEGYFSTESVYTLEEKKGFLRNLPVVKQVADVFGFAVNTIEDASQFIETLPRLAEYMILKDQGESLEVAALGAADVTTNFSRSGPIGKAINGWVLYWNAGMQGLDKTVRQVKKNPGGTLAKAMVSQMIVSAILSAINGKNPYYDDEDQSVKDAYFLIPNYLGERDGIWAKTFIKIPRSREWGVLLGASLDRLINGIMDGNVNMDTFSGLAGETISNLMPPDIGGNTMLDMWSRRALFNRNDPGKTWYGGDIVPYRLQNLSPNEQHDVQTSNAATWMAQGFNKLFNTYGGNAELSPEKVDDLLDTYGGYLGDLLQAGTSPKNQGKNFVETGLNTLKAVTVDPFVKRFTTDPRYSSGLVNQFYDDWSAAQEAYNNNKAGVKLTKKQEELLKDYKRLQAINKELSSLYKRERAMYGEKDSAANKSKKSKDYREQINDILRDYYYD